MQEIITILDKRNEAYNKAKHFDVSTENKTEEDCVNEIIIKSA
jgi:shikimate kinase